MPLVCPCHQRAWLFPQLQGIRGAESREKATIPSSKLAPSLSPTGGLTPGLLPGALAPKCCSSWLTASVAPGNMHSGWAAFIGAPSSPAAPLCTPLKGAHASRSLAEGFPAPANPRAPHPGGGTEGWWLSFCSPPTPSSEALDGHRAGCVAVGTQRASGAGLSACIRVTHVGPWSFLQKSRQVLNAYWSSGSLWNCGKTPGLGLPGFKSQLPTFQASDIGRGALRPGSSTARGQCSEDSVTLA